MQHLLLILLTALAPSASLMLTRPLTFAPRLTSRLFSTATLPAPVNPHPENNVTPTIDTKIGRNLHLLPNHPLNTIKTIIVDHFNNNGQSFNSYDSFPPVVKIQNW